MRSMDHASAPPGGEAQANYLWRHLLGGHREEIRPGLNPVAGTLPEGCRRCLLGGRLCLSLGEACAKGCFYCSSAGSGDLVQADEFTVRSDEELLRLVRMGRPDAVCLTGGEPSNYLDRAVHYARLLREACGPDFHIQFFTANPEFSLEEMKRVRAASVDEIRCHPYSAKEMPLVERALELDWTVAVEIPCIPRLGITEKIVEGAITAGVAFINLHELLYMQTDSFERVARRAGLEPGEVVQRKVPCLPGGHPAPPGDFIARPGTSLRATLGSRDLADQLMERARRDPDCTTDIHFCSMASKFRTQVPNQMARRARSLARPFEDVSPDGTLVSAVVACSDARTAGIARDTLRGEANLGEEQVLQHEQLLFVSWTLLLDRDLLGRLPAGTRVSLYERYPVPAGVRIGEDGIHLEFSGTGPASP
jgi:pyruvate formate-lyase activating enzyme-like uncharacterized protein